MSTHESEIDILRELEPVAGNELDRHLRVAQPWHPHDYVPWSEGRDFAMLGGKDWDPSQSRLSDIAQTSMRVNLLTEDNLPSYHLEIANNFGRSGAWGEWVGQWTAEEGRHGTAMRDLLMVTRAVDPVELEEDRMAQVKAGYSAGDKSPLHIIAYVTFQELATRISHRNAGEACLQDGDELAEKLMARIAKDENLHMLFYRNLGQAALDMAPNAMMRAITDEVVGFQMPGAGIRNFKRDAVKMAKAGIYDMRQHHDDVLLPILKKVWKVFDREDLTGDGAAARDQLGPVLEYIDSQAKEFEERKQAAAAS